MRISNTDDIVGFKSGPSLSDMRTHEVVSGEASGGTNTSHTIVIEALTALLAAVPPDAPHSAYQRAALHANVLGKQTEGARRRTLRYLKELYLLRPDSLLFRALRDLWADDPAARPLLAGLCAVARDAVFRASARCHARFAHPNEDLLRTDMIPL